jgi:hypothetical protein
VTWWNVVGRAEARPDVTRMSIMTFLWVWLA